MKKILFLMILILLCIGCEEERKNEFDHFIKFESDTLYIKSNTTDTIIHILFNTDWNVKSNDKWINVSKLQDGYIKVITEKNNFFDDRIGKIYIDDANNSISDTLYINQDAKRGIILHETAKHVSGEEGIFSIEFESNMDEIQIITPTWIKELKNVRSLKNYDITFSFQANSTNETRIGIIEFKHDNDIVATYSIKQDILEASHVSVSGIPEFININSEKVFPIITFPDNASLKDLRIEIVRADGATMFPPHCDYSINKNERKLIIKTTSTGSAYINIFNKNEFMETHKITTYEYFTLRGYNEYHSQALNGTAFFLNANIPITFYTLSTESNDLISIDENNMIITNIQNTGRANITGVDKYLGLTSEYSIDIVNCMIWNEYTRLGGNKTNIIEGSIKLKTLENVYVYSIKILDGYKKTIAHFGGENIPTNNTSSITCNYSFDTDMYNTLISSWTYVIRYNVLKNGAFIGEEQKTFSFTSNKN